MKLQYRGISYEYTPPVVETVEGNVGGKYRGLDWRFRNLKKAPILQPSVNLTYRGVSYSNNPSAIAQSQEVVAQADPTPVMPISEQARSLMMNRDRAVKKRHQSMLSRLAAEVGLNISPSEYYNQV
ncbi:DUF4278 domain-containing protein [Kamptonema sp. UHCC 0994]|uniref:DUF4278 domain-containing protein n=1 Tax=Kamptonema sp. UHCC 0994 TaxID=3031329 RepID=UPI0023BB0812|nr:DUF4278 domain-containing protein [Kamptonema sp. UHCC 0994]MDF0556200.1 DUF4278 domain-containing protein [Kamptonema sp. UHCC 0994]